MKIYPIKNSHFKGSTPDDPYGKKKITPRPVVENKEGTMSLEEKIEHQMSGYIYMQQLLSSGILKDTKPNIRILFEDKNNLT